MYYSYLINSKTHAYISFTCKKHYNEYIKISLLGLFLARNVCVRHALPVAQEHHISRAYLSLYR